MLNKQEIIKLRKQGMKLREIAELLNTTPQAVNWHIQHPEIKPKQKYQPSTKYKKVKRYADYLVEEQAKKEKKFF